VKDIHEILRQKEADAARVRQEIDALRLTIALLEDKPSPDTDQRKQPEPVESSAERAEGTGTEGPSFSSIGQSESSFWKRRR
jgi:hypothetical protein